MDIEQTAITGYHYIRHAPFNVSNFGLFSEIRIGIQANEIYFPQDSFLSLEGSFQKNPAAPNANPNCNVINMGFLHAFDSINYLINGTQVDGGRKPGVSATLKSLTTIGREQVTALQNSGFNGSELLAPSSIFHGTDSNRFHVLIPLKLILGFFEDHGKIICGVSQELVLTRASSDLDVFAGTEQAANVTLSFDKIYWIIPQIKLADYAKARLYTAISKNLSMKLSFRSWSLHEFPKIPTASKFVWSIKTTGAAHRPKYAIIGFSINRKNNITKNLFETDPMPDLCGYRLIINSEVYPFQESYVKFSSGSIAELYQQYLTFYRAYGNNNNNMTPLMDRATFAKRPLICIDCSRSEATPGAIASDVSLEIQSEKDFPEDTTCIVLLIHQNVINYSPLSGVVQ